MRRSTESPRKERGAPHRGDSIPPSRPCPIQAHSAERDEEIPGRLHHQNIDGAQGGHEHEKHRIGYVFKVKFHGIPALHGLE